MLVLSRKAGEQVVLDSNITVEIIRIQGNRVTIGISAPAEVKILRGELTPHSAKSQTKATTLELVVEDGLLTAC